MVRRHVAAAATYFRQVWNIGRLNRSRFPRALAVACTTQTMRTLWQPALDGARMLPVTHQMREPATCVWDAAILIGMPIAAIIRNGV